MKDFLIGIAFVFYAVLLMALFHGGLMSFFGMFSLLVILLIAVIWWLADFLLIKWRSK
jgi:hypothetical protein